MEKNCSLQELIHRWFVSESYVFVQDNYACIEATKEYKWVIEKYKERIEEPTNDTKETW